MAFTLRQLAVRARLAPGALVRVLDREELVGRFLDSYALQFKRPGRKEHPAHFREQASLIRRESLLALVTWMLREAPARLAREQATKMSDKARGHARHQARSKRRGGAARIMLAGRQKGRMQAKAVAEAIELFREEFLDALGTVLSREGEDFEEFCRDLEFYDRLARAPHAIRPGKQQSPRKLRVMIAGPFVDRVGLLLDPSLLENARRAAAELQGELEATAGRVLKDAFSRKWE